MSLLRRRIDLTFTLAEGNFGALGQNTVTIRGARVSVDVVKAGLPGADACNLRVWGLSKSHMNTLSTLGKTYLEVRKNTVAVYAGDDVNGMALIFNGVMKDAFQDFQGAPDASLNVYAFVGQVEAAKPIDPTSYRDTVNIATALESLATQAGLGFENNGVSEQIANPYWPGTALAQIKAILRHANCYGTIEDSKLYIWPKKGARKGDPVTFSPSTGLVGYPRAADYGIGFSALYRPGVAIGQKVKLETSITTAAGEWVIYGLKYALESEMPGGKWFMDIEGYRQQSVQG